MATCLCCGILEGMKKPVGRPTKYKPEYCQMVVDHMAKGASLTSFAAEIDVARSTINEWMDANPDFSEAVKRAKAKCAAWWERLGRNNAITGDGNATLVIFGLKNMAAEDWREKQEIDHTTAGQPMQSVQDAVLAALKAKHEPE